MALLFSLRVAFKVALLWRMFDTYRQIIDIVVFFRCCFDDAICCYTQMFIYITVCYIKYCSHIKRSKYMVVCICIYVSSIWLKVLRMERGIYWVRTSLKREIFIWSANSFLHENYTNSTLKEFINNNIKLSATLRHNRANFFFLTQNWQLTSFLNTFFMETVH